MSHIIDRSKRPLFQNHVWERGYGQSMCIQCGHVCDNRVLDMAEDPIHTSTCPKGRPVASVAKSVDNFIKNMTFRDIGMPFYVKSDKIVFRTLDGNQRPDIEFNQCLRNLLAQLVERQIEHDRETTKDRWADE